MANPKWFVAKDYMAAKLAQVQAIDPKGNWTAASLTKVMEEAGYKGDDGAYQHFNDFGMAENVSPNALFNVTEYLAAKAAQMNASLKAGETAWTEASILKAITDANMTVWGHYQAFGSKEDVNPSNAFDAALYLEAKAAAMNAAGEKQADGSEWTAAAVEDAIHNANMSVLEHFTTFAGAGTGEVAADATFADPTPVTPTPGFDPYVPVVDPVVGETKYLTVDQDNIIGTANNDTFNATIFDNQNTLQSGDRVDGGAGHDVLNADLGTSALFAATPEIKNVEVIKFRAQANAKDSGSNNVAGDGADNLAAHIDAERIQAGDDGKLQLWSQDSRADLVIEDVRVNSNNVTIGMGNTDSGDVDMSVYFNNQYLKSEDTTTTGKLNLQLIDTVGALTEAQGGHADPLYDNPYTGFKFKLDGKDYEVNFKAYNHTTDETPTYAELAAQIQAAIDADATLSKLGLTVALDGTFDAVVGIGDHKGATVTGEKIVVTSSNGALTGGNWLASNGLPETNSTSATMSTTQSDSCPLIKTDVALDNVGQVQWDDASACLPDDSTFGSKAGDLVIGAMGTRGGVERFDVTVEQGSWLSSMSSTNNTLRMVTVKNGDTGSDGTDAGAGKGQLFIGDSLAAGNNMIDWQDAPRLLSNDGLSDVKTFDASAMGGNVNIGAQITSASYDKYLKDVDGVDSMASSYAPNGPFSYKTGTGDDTINMTVNGGVAADRDFVMNIETGAGSDLINFTFGQYVNGTLVGMTPNELADQMALKNVTINAGAGNDTIKANGAGSVNINGGAGNDTIYADNSGGQVVSATLVGGEIKTTNSNAVWVLNTDGTEAARAINSMFISGAQSLNNDILSAVNDKMNITGDIAAGTSLEVSVTFMGVTVKGTVASWANGVKAAADEVTTATITDEMINAAIIKAINEDATLSKMLVAKDGAGYSLILESLIDGKMEGKDELKVDFNVFDKDGKDGTLNGWTAPTQYTTEKFATVMNDLAYTEVTGADSKAESDNVINGGADNDLLILGTGALSNDTVKFDAGFGHDTVINFTAGAVSDTNTGADKMDFKSFFGADKMADKISDTLANNSVVSFDANAADTDGKGLTVAEVISYINSDSVKLGAQTEAGDILFLVKGIDGAEGDYYAFSADVAKDGAIAGAVAEGSITLAGVAEDFNITTVVLA